jgi:serine/threonine protein phosphatase PrpC
VSSKKLYRLGDKNFKVGMATMHGWRETMEDAHTLQLSMENHPNAGYFGIFDGHSGSLCSNYISERLILEIDKLASFDNESLAKTCMKVDQQFLDEYKHNEDGCAGIFTIVQINDGKISIVNANIGDSRTVLAKSEGNGKYTAVTCTEDHKPTDPKERARIEVAGGCVQASRVDGQLALSRAFGDRQLKTPVHARGEDRKVTSNPDFTHFEVGKDDFILMCCDGIYEGDIFGRQDVIDWVAEKLKDTTDIAAVCGQLLDECLTRGSHDNMSALIIQFTDGTSYAQPKWEYLPGPWFDGDDAVKFQSAYSSDAQSAGYTIEQARALRKKMEAEQQQQQQK